MRTWYERWLDGEASVIFGKDGPDSDETIQSHNKKSWYDEATDEELEELVAWVELEFPDVVLIGGNWHRKSDGRMVCDCCYSRVVKVYTTLCGYSALCRECDDELCDAYWMPRYYKQALEDPSSIHPITRAKLRKRGYDI